MIFYKINNSCKEIIVCDVFHSDLIPDHNIYFLDVTLVQIWTSVILLVQIWTSDF